MGRHSVNCRHSRLLRPRNGQTIPLQQYVSLMDVWRVKERKWKSKIRRKRKSKTQKRSRKHKSKLAHPLNSDQTLMRSTAFRSPQHQVRQALSLGLRCRASERMRSAPQRNKQTHLKEEVYTQTAKKVQQHLRGNIAQGGRHLCVRIHLVHANLREPFEWQCRSLNIEQADDEETHHYHRDINTTSS